MNITLWGGIAYILNIDYILNELFTNLKAL
jgi:hypothetical protein